MDEFIKKYLKTILDNDVDEDIIQYIKKMKSVEDFDEFIENVIDRENADHTRNYKELKNLLFGGAQQIKINSVPPVKKNKKQSQNNTFSDAFPTLPGNKGKSELVQGQSNTKIPYQAKSLLSASSKGMTFTNTPTKPDTSNKVSPQGNSSGGKSKKPKFVNIESFDSSVGLKKGRHPCNCEARIHQLINNCLKCGRIVCEQEGSGACFFCDNMVCTNQELSILESNSKQSDKLYNLLREQKTSKEWKKAIETRDRLLSADKSEDYKRTIYDDQSDYYAGDKWKNEGVQPSRRIHKSRKDLKLALDLASRMVVIGSDSVYEKNKEALLKGVNKLLDTTEERFPKNLYDSSSEFNDSVSFENSLSEEVNEEGREQMKKTITSRLNTIKVANDAFLAEIDRGMCLSMHQPWASLLVAGVKIHEGRTWYTAHRGRLWIHAAQKEPQSNDILEVEKMYREIYNDPELVFPRLYPTSCLLGCVFIEDCLNQRRYRELYPQGESDSPFVLICTNPIILPIFLPMQGQHKIFPLARDVHTKAKEGIMSAKWI